MASRPERGDTEEDLLVFQEQFLASRNSPSVTVIRESREPELGKGEVQRDLVELHGLSQNLESELGNLGPPRKKSKFKERRMAKNKEKMHFTLEDNEDAAERLERHDRHISTVLNEIKERDIQRSQISQMSMPTGVLQKGFPEVLHRGNITEKENNSNQGKRSLFAQHFKASNPNEFGSPQLTQQCTASLSKTDKTLNKDVKHQLEAPFCKPSLVTGEGLTTLPIDNHETTASREAERIHLENIDRLSAMPQESIILEQDKLLKSLDPSFLAFLKSRQKKKTLKTENTEQKMETQEISSSLPTAEMHTSIPQRPTQTSDSINDNQTRHVSFDDNVEMINTEEKDKVSEVENLKLMASTQKWVHMDTMEIDKLEWMKDCPPPSAIKTEGGH